MKKKVEVRLSHPEHPNMYLCEKCMSWSGEFLRQEAYTGDKIWTEVSCLCNSIVCKKCGKTRKMPGFCVWTISDDYFAYVPTWTGIRPCSSCGGKMEKDQHMSTKYDNYYEYLYDP